jgi:diaminopimelate decarboxylase
VIDLFPVSARVEDGELTLGGVSTSALAGEFGTPLVVYCEETIRTQARAYRAAAPNALVAYGTKAFANVALLRVLVEEGLGADVSTLGELAFARAAGMPDERLVLHGNNKSDDELAAGAGTLVVLDGPDELERARAAGAARLLVRVTPGVVAETHASIRTAHEGSKFGLTPEQARTLIERDPEILGVHLHVGSQLRSLSQAREAVEALAAFVESCGGWRPRVLDLGGGLGVRYLPEDVVPTVEEYVSAQLSGWTLEAPDQLVLEPGRSLVGRAGVTLYRIGAVKEAGGGVRYAAVDGGMSDNPRPQLYDARLTALVAGRADAPPDGTYAVSGKHCESGDVLAREVPLAAPRDGDLLAVPATGAYTLAMSSNYNGVPRPAVVLVSEGDARLIRRRETTEDLLAREVG